MNNLYIMTIFNTVKKKKNLIKNLIKLKVY